MRRLWPDSLFGRIALVLLTGLILAQAGSALINARERNHLLRQSDERQWQERVAATVRLLNALPAEERPPALDALVTRRLTIEIVAHESSTPVQEASDAAGQLAALLGSGYRVRAWREPERNLIHAAVQLHDRSWLVIDYNFSVTAFGWPLRLLLSLAVLLVAALVLTLLATRAALDPLERVIRAAERLGENLDAPPIAETGAREVRRAARTLNRMQARILESVAERTRLLAAISHDLKTPLTRLRLRAEFIHEDPELREALLQEVETMQAMTRAVLDVLRGGEGEAIRNVDMNALIEGLAEDAKELGANVTINGRARLPYPGRSIALRRALGNLMDNVRYYAGGTMEIVVEDNDQMLLIRIVDHGPGIPEAEQMRMLEPFQRLEPSRNPATGGSGLGLAIARSVVHAHGGELDLSNRVGGGLEVRVTLPRSASAASI